MPIYEPVLFLKPEHLYIAKTARVDSWTKIEAAGGVRIGEYVHIASFVHMIGGGEIIFEDYSAASSGAKIVSGSNDISAISCSAAAPEAMQLRKQWKVTIGRYAIIFTNAVVMASVGEGAVVAAGAVVTKAVPNWEIWGGVPAKKIGERKVKDAIIEAWR